MSKKSEFDVDAVWKEQKGDLAKLRQIIKITVRRLENTIERLNVDNEKLNRDWQEAEKEVFDLKIRLTDQPEGDAEMLKREIAPLTAELAGLRHQLGVETANAEVRRKQLADMTTAYDLLQNQHDQLQDEHHERKDWFSPEQLRVLRCIERGEDWE